MKHAQGVISEAPPLGRVRSHRASCFLPAPKLLVEGIGRQRCLPGEVSRQHTEDQNTERPHVQTGGHKETFSAASAAHLWRGVGDGATHPFHTTAHAPGHSKVGQLDAAALAVKQEHILRFHIPMHQVFTVHEVQGQAQLLHAAFDHLLWQTHLRKKSVSRGEQKERETEKTN